MYTARDEAKVPGKMEGTHAEDDDLPQRNKDAEQEQRQKSIATRHPSQTGKISKLSLSRTRDYINEQKRLMEQKEGTGGIDECYEITGEILGSIGPERFGDSE